MMNQRNDASTGSTTGSGAPAPSDRNSLSIGPDGPVLLHDVHFLEQMAHFNREKVPERQPHAKGSGAFGRFETTADVSRWTKAALFRKGATTEMLARFCRRRVLRWSRFRPLRHGMALRVAGRAEAVAPVG